MNPFRNRNGHSINGDLISRLTKKYGSLLRPCARVCALFGERVLVFSPPQRILYLTSTNERCSTKTPTNFHRHVFPRIAIEYSASERKPACLRRQLRTAYKSLDEISLSYAEFERNKEKTRSGGKGGGKRRGGKARNIPPLEIFLRSTNNNDDDNNNNNNNNNPS